MKWYHRFAAFYNFQLTLSIINGQKQIKTENHSNVIKGSRTGVQIHSSLLKKKRKDDKNIIKEKTTRESQWEKWQEEKQSVGQKNRASNRVPGLQWQKACCWWWLIEPKQSFWTCMLLLKTSLISNILTFWVSHKQEKVNVMRTMESKEMDEKTNSL